MGTKKAKLGARVLTDEELKLIIPNAELISNQIELFRKSLSKDRSQNAQKTNNIGIVGSRGAGKTSVLRTFHKKLENNNADRKYKDIILPIIIPENMSSQAVLMDAILGMMKTVVDEKEKKNESYSNSDCIYSPLSEITKSYHKLVQQYCYIKQDYRDILIQQFTTEQYYVDKTKQIFNSDTEFIKCFDEFVNKILECHTNTENDAMIFIFIDDIDLSTTRCLDVVKTLLSYLAHERIVTFISGDVETFEEALTLDFLRQEKALQPKLLNETFFNTADSEKGKLLERKKTLAYEYLKKVIPPAYRFQIKKWGLSERALYQISEYKDKKDEEKNSDNEQVNLGELLSKLTQSCARNKYFMHHEPDDEYSLPVKYHMFDENSRGLNNVYNVLLEVFEEKDAKKEINLQDLKIVLETMVMSKFDYACYADIIFGKIILFENGKGKVDFGNARSWLYPESGDNENNKGVEEKSKVQKFALFLLFDFARQLFKLDNEDTDYNKMKMQVLFDYINEEEIDGKWNKTLEEKLLFQDVYQKIESGKSCEVANLLFNIFQKTDFFFGLNLVKFLGRDTICDLFRKELYYNVRNDYYTIFYALAQTVSAMTDEKSKENYLVYLFNTMEKELPILINSISLDREIVWGEKIINQFIPSIPSMRGIYNIDQFMSQFRNNQNIGNGIDYVLWLYYKCKYGKYSIDFEFEYNKTIKNGEVKAVIKKCSELFSKYKVNTIESMNYSNVIEKDRHYRFFDLVDKKNIWTQKFIQDNVKRYFIRNISDNMNALFSGNLLFDGMFLYESDAYKAFIDCKTGNSGKALIISLKHDLKELLDLFKMDGNCSEPLIFWESIL